MVVVVVSYGSVGVLAAQARHAAGWSTAPGMAAIVPLSVPELTPGDVLYHYGVPRGWCMGTAIYPESY